MGTYRWIGATKYKPHDASHAAFFTPAASAHDKAMSQSTDRLRGTLVSAAEMQIARPQ